MVSLESLNCNNCGAPLESSLQRLIFEMQPLRYKACHSPTGSATFTERLEAIESSQQRIESKQQEIEIELSLLQVQNKIADLDRRRELQKKEFMIRDKNGREYLPSVENAYLAGVLERLFPLSL